MYVVLEISKNGARILRIYKSALQAASYVNMLYDDNDRWLVSYDIEEHAVEDNATVTKR